MYEIDTYAVTGWPLTHSLSPQIHHYFATLMDCKLEYIKLAFTQEKFEQGVHDFFANGGKGLNVTLPYKQQAFALLNQHTPAAQQVRAVNTIFLKNNQLCGDNTDGVGFITDLCQHKAVAVKDKSVLLLGAGGAAVGVLPYLLSEKPKHLILANRTLSKAQMLKDQYYANQEVLQCCALDELGEHSFDVIINATSASVTQQNLIVPQSCVTSKTQAYDLAYGESAKKFIDQLYALGACQVYDGWGMLVEQAAHAFARWRGVQPDTAELIKHGYAFFEQ